MKKKILSLLLAMLLLCQVFALVSCDDTSDTPSDETQPILITNNDNGEQGGEEGGGENSEQTQPSKIKNLILIIGDGMGLEHIAAGELFEEKDYAFTNWQFTSSNTDSISTSGIGGVLTDSAAGGTALATGHLTVNNYIGKDYKGADVTTILDLAKNTYGKSTGVVTTDALYGATPSAFSAHNISRSNYDDILISQLTSGVDLLCGSTDSKCTSKQAQIASAGYAYCDDFSKISSIMPADKTYWQFNLAGTSASVQLKDAAVQACTYLDQDKDGFVLMIEQAHIDKYSHDNDFYGVVSSVKSLNDTVDALLAWLGDRTDTAILITADHETGGLSVSTQNVFAKRYSIRKDLWYAFSSTGHTNAKVGVFVYGIEPDFSKLSYYGSQHVIKNIDVYNLMADVMQNPDAYRKAA